MEYQLNKLSNNQAEFVFDVNKEEWQSCIEGAYKKTKNQYQIQGFRKGHVPMNVLVKRYGIQLFFEDAIDVAIERYWQEAFDKENLELVDSPALEVKEVSEDGLKFAVKVTVRPEFKLGEYKGLSIDKEPVKVSAKEVTEAINRELDNHSRMVDVDDRAAKKGDVVNIDYSGSVDGVKFDGGTAEKQDLELGSGSFIPGFEEQVEGMNIGEERDINVTFPKDYHEHLAGKDAVFHIVLHAIKVKEVPALDDEFVKDVSEKSATVEEYKKEVKARLTEQAEQRAKNIETNRLLAKIVENTSIDIPEVMIENEMDTIVEEESNHMKQQGFTLEMYLEYLKMSKEDFRAQYKEEAANSVKSRLVLEAIVKEEHIEATEEDVDNELAKYSETSGKSVEDIRKDFQGMMGYIKNNIVNQKLVDFLRSNNKFVAKKAAPKADAENKEVAEGEAKPAKKAPAKKAAKKAE